MLAHVQACGGINALTGGKFPSLISFRSLRSRDRERSFGRWLYAILIFECQAKIGCKMNMIETNLHDWVVRHKHSCRISK